MSNTMYISAQTAYLKAFTESAAPSPTASTEFAQALDNCINERSLDDYKAYINDRVSSLILHPTQFGDTYAVSISDAGYRAMQENPNYEKWVLEQIHGAFSSEIPSWLRQLGGTQYHTLQFGSKPEQFRQTSFSTGEGALKKEEKEEYWKQLKELRDKRREEFEKLLKKKRIALAQAQALALERRLAFADMIEADTDIPDAMSYAEANVSEIPPILFLDISEILAMM
ncbi:MAG: hypothetical protein IJT87_07935 [Ruminiclostridium sp.]|nr:hypothetical protein [Ruminiclostridium sp.]